MQPYFFDNGIRLGYLLTIVKNNKQEMDKDETYTKTGSKKSIFK
jgi:hypothetical protein